MTRYISFNSFKYAQKSFTYVAEAPTPLLRHGTFSWIVTRDSHNKVSQFPTLVSAHLCLVGRGPQVENRCYSPFQSEGSTTETARFC